MTTRKPRTNSRKAAIYCRISDDRNGERAGVQDQERRCRALAKQHGLTVVGAPYVDNDIGASTRSRKKSRAAYDQMIHAVEAGEFGVVLAYSNSRLTRRLAELEDLIQLHERTGVVFMTVVSGNDNLSTADGRMVARIKASVDSAEAERIGERVAAARERQAKAGAYNGGR